MKNCARAQAGLEYVALVAFALVLLIPAGVYVYQNALVQANVAQAELAAARIANAADSVKAQPAGSKTTIEVYLPPGVNAASVSGREVLIRMNAVEGKVVDVYRVAQANLSTNSLPTSEGVYVLELVHQPSTNVTVTAKDLQPVPSEAAPGKATPEPTPTPTPAVTPAPQVDGLSVYYDSTGATIPRYRIYNSTGWSGEANAIDLNNTANVWTVLKAAPTRNESLLVTQDAAENIVAQTWNGSRWNNASVLSATGARREATRGFDLAYEDSRGNAVAVYRNTSNVTTPFYRTWNGSAWSAGQPTRNLGSGVNITWLRLAAKPGANEMILLAHSANDDLFGLVWDGSAWSAPTAFETNAPCSYECFDAAYENNSGDGLVAYREGTSDLPRYRTYVSGSWSGEGTANDVGGDPEWIRFASDPTSNTIVMAVLDRNEDLNAQAWSGTGWGSVTELDNDLNVDTKRCFDIAYQANGTALVVYGERNVNTPTYRLYTTGWSSPSSATNIGEEIEWGLLAANRSSNDILLAVINDVDDVSVQRWNGGAWSGYQVLETSSDDTYQSVAVAYRRDK